MATRKVKFDFIPEALKGKRISESERKEILNEVADFVVESILKDVGSTKSPVTGRKFKKLSEDYKKLKKEAGSGTSPNLELDGDMLDSLTAKVVGNKIRVTVGDAEQGKADGHNNFSGKSKLPRRPFIPDEQKDETFRPKLRKEIDDLVEDLLA